MSSISKYIISYTNLLLDSNPRILLRRVYTVRLVPSSAVGIQSLNKSSTNEVNIEESTIPTTENSFTQLFSTNSDNITTLSDEESLGTTTFSSSSISSPLFSESSTIEEITTTLINEFSTKELIEETTTLLTNKEELPTTTTTENNLEEESSPSTTLKVPSARPLEFSPTFSTKIPTKPSTSPSKTFSTFSTRQHSKTTEKINFALPRYHWLLNNPTNNVLIGKLDVIDYSNKEEMLNKFEMIIEPPQFRQWFKVDSEV